MGQFQALREFHVHSEAQLQEAHHTLRSGLVSQLKIPKGATEDEVQELLSEHANDIDDCDWRYKFAFARLLRFSTVVMCFTLVESNLSRVANEMSRRRNLTLCLSDLQAKDLVKRFKKFWTRVANLSWWDDDVRWNLLQDVEQLRHCIVHRNGIIRENEKRLPELVRRGTGVRLLGANEHLVDPDDVGTLVVEHSFCRLIIDELTVLFREVFDQAGCFGPEAPIVE
jgi:hypothetical protein